MPAAAADGDGETAVVTGGGAKSGCCS
jgi:hypothetical protein